MSFYEADNRCTIYLAVQLYNIDITYVNLFNLGNLNICYDNSISRIKGKLFALIFI